MGKIFAICDRDRVYVKNLMQYINSRQSIPLKLQAFTSPELLKEYARQNQIELLLISIAVMDEEIAALPIGRIVVLTEDGPVDLNGIPSVNRYQASGTLVQEVMEYYSAGNLAVVYTAAKLAAAQMIAVYSPVRRCGKTAFALALGEAYARSKKVLYINLEEFSGFRTLMEREYHMDISDLLYFYREEKQGMLRRMEEAVQRLGQIFYLPPAMCPSDIRSVLPEEWREWFLILLQSSYDLILVEPGECVSGLEEILSLCSRIYIPELKDRTSNAKLQQYENYLTLSGWESLKGRMQRQAMPAIQGKEEWGIMEYKESDEMKWIAERIVRETGHD